MGLNKIIIKNGRILCGEDFIYGDVSIENGVITSVGEPMSTADYVYDAKGNIVCPGMVDIHTHLRNISCRDFGVNAEAACFPFGVTAAADASAIFGNRELSESFMLKNLVFVCSDIKNNHADFSETEKLLQRYGDKAVGIKIYFDTTVSDLWDIQPLIEVCDYAHSHNLRVMVHCTNSPAETSEVLSNLGKGDICTHIYHGGKNNVAEDGFSALKKAQKRGVIIDAGMAGGVHTDFSLLKSAIENSAFPDTISSDITSYSLFTRGGKYGMTMCMSIMRTLGMTEQHILKCVTSNAAKAVGMENYWGCISKNRCADVTVLEYGDNGFDITDKAGNRIRSSSGYQCLLTISDGQIVYKN